MTKLAYSVSFLLSINIFVWQNFLYFPYDLHITDISGNLSVPLKGWALEGGTDRPSRNICKKLPLLAA